jgi:hypothetical protein
MCQDKFERRQIKMGSGVPTIPASTDHRNGDWIATDIYDGEFYMDTDTGLTYTRNGASIIPAGSGAENFANADLTLTDNRVHQLNGYNFSLVDTIGVDLLRKTPIETTISHLIGASEQSLTIGDGVYTLKALTTPITINTGNLILPSIPTYANEAGAVGGGLATGTLYKTATGELRIKL